MGDEFLRKRGKRFKNLSDEDYEQKLATPNLFSGREHVFMELYPCVAKNGVGELPPGLEVMVYDTGCDDLLVRQGANNIGTIAGADANQLRDAMRLHTLWGSMVRGQIDRQSPFSKRFHIRISGMNIDCTNSNGSYS